MRLVDLGCALRESAELGRAEEVFAQAVELAAAAGDRAGEARARVESSFARLHTAQGGLEQLVRVADAARPVLEAAGDDTGVARALMLQLEAEIIRCRLSESRRLAEDALARLDPDDEEDMHFLRSALVLEALRGPTPADEAIARCEAIAARGPGGPAFDAHYEGVVGCLEAMRGRFDVARSRAARGRTILEELGRPLSLVMARADAGTVELLAGEPAAAVEHFRWGYDRLRALGERGMLPTLAALLANALADAGATEEALETAAVSEEATVADDVLTQVLWRRARAKALARRGDANAAEPLAREAVELAARTDDVNLEADAHATLAEVLRTTRPQQATSAMRRALVLYERKGNVAALERLQVLSA